MSHPANDAYLEELEQLEEDYKDAKLVMEQADEDFRKAYDWKQSRIEKCNQLAHRLQELKNRE